MADRYFVDVSNFTARFQAGRYAKSGPMLVGVLATDGVDFVSPAHAEQAAHAHEAGLDVWHYHFARPGNLFETQSQMEHFWQTVKPRYHAGDRLVLDIETLPLVGDLRLIPFTHALDDKLHHISGVQAVGYTYDSLLREAGRDLQIKSGAWWIAKPDGLLLPLGAGRKCIARQVRLDGVGKGPSRFPGVEGFDVDELAFWYARRLAADRRRRRQSVQ